MRKALILFLALGALGCSPSAATLERELEKELTRVVGPARDYQVESEGLRFSAGTAESVTVTGLRVQPKKGPVLDRVVAEFHDVAYDRKAAKLSSVGHARAEVWLAEADAAAYLDELEEVDGARVDFAKPDRVDLRGTAHVGPFSVPAEVQGRFVSDGSTLNLDVQQARASGIPVGAGMIEKMEEDLNPILDLSKLPVRLEITELRTEGDHLVLVAEGAYP